MIKLILPTHCLGCIYSWRGVDSYMCTRAGVPIDRIIKACMTNNLKETKRESKQSKNNIETDVKERAPTKSRSVPRRRTQKRRARPKKG
jgi:hypothetical protein